MGLEKYYNETDIQTFPIIFSKKFLKILSRIDDIVSKELLNLTNDKIRFRETFIDITEKEDMVTFISSDKVNKMIVNNNPNFEDECWSTPQRVEIRIGRFIFRLLSTKVTDQDIENFVNEYKSIIQEKKLKRNFQIVEGEEIKKWYLNSNYVEGGGNLSNSCMGHRFCQDFFDIYIHNPDKVKLLILLDDSREKILGRSLLWNLDSPENKVFMDRVYFSQSFILNMFINYAIVNKWYYKLESMENLLNVVLNNVVVRLTMVVNIKKEKYKHYPFVDNLGFYDPIHSVLTNNPKYLKSLGCKKYFDLSDNTGDYFLSDKFDF